MRKGAIVAAMLAAAILLGAQAYDTRFKRPYPEDIDERRYYLDRPRMVECLTRGWGHGEWVISNLHPSGTCRR